MEALKLNSMKSFKGLLSDLQPTYYKNKTYWHIVGDTVYEMVRDAFFTGKKSHKV